MPGVYYPQCLATVKAIFDDRAATGVGGSGTIAGSSAKPFVIPVRPRSATVGLNSYREADTFELDFDASTFPISPEIVQSMAVELHLFQTSKQASLDISANGQFVDDYGPGVLTEQNLVISGLVDEAHMHAGSDGRTFRISGRDYTALLLDRQWDQTKRVPVGKTLKDTVQDLVDECDAAGVLTVRLVGLDDDTQLEPPRNAQDSRLVTTGKTGGGKLRNPHVGSGYTHVNKKGVPQHSGSNYWDVIYRLCVRHGFIPYVRGTDVIISTPKVLTQATKGRSTYVTMGINLKTLDIDRKLGKETVPQCKVISYDPDQQKSLEAVYPLHPSDKVTGIGTKKNETRLFTVYGINDLGRLQQMAQLAYENLTRSEAKIRFSTKSLTDLHGNDLLALRPADPVALDFDAIGEKDYKELTPNQRLDKLLRLGYDYDVASVVAFEYDRVNVFSRPFYCQDVEFAWSLNEGVSITVSGVNYIHAKDDTP